MFMWSEISKDKSILKTKSPRLQDNFMHEYFVEFLKLDEAQFQIRWKT